jgi:tRNA (guanine37-N1)-methyltransferase
MLKEALSNLLSKDEISELSSAFDVIGDIAIIKIPEQLRHREGAIAGQILLKMKNVHTVLKQSSNVEGEFRTRKVDFIAGEEKFETLYKESGCIFKVNVASIYFSPRLSTERERIAALANDGEHIFNMFAGLGTFSIIIAKKKNCVIESVDKNPEAIHYAIESLKLNRHLRGSVNPLLQDARAYSEEHPLSFDRVLMPLPERSFDFLDAAVGSTKPRGMIHYYTHVSQEDFQDEKWIGKHLDQKGITREYSVKKWKRVREVGPRYIQAVADIEMLS